MYYVYLIQSVSLLEKIYVGYTLNIEQRLATHNAGGSIYTAQYKPWKLIAFFGFQDETKAKEFELYLKSQTGRAFIKKRVL